MTETTTHSDSEDAALMLAIASGDRRAAEQFVRRHGAYVLKICMQRLKNQTLAEEATQEVFLSVWRHAASWQPGTAKVTTWLYRIAANRCIDMLRRHRPTEDLDAVAEPADEADTAEQVLHLADRNRHLQAALATLNARQREAIDLVYFQEINQRQAAEMMGLKLAALESILRRARQRLHTELARLESQLRAV